MIVNQIYMELGKYFLIFFAIFFAFLFQCKYLYKNNLKCINKIKYDIKKRRINLWVDLTLYEQIRSKAADAYLPISTFARQLLRKAINN
jgi:hypothetical protein